MNRHFAKPSTGPRSHGLILVLLACLSFTPGTAGAGPVSAGGPAEQIGSAQRLGGATTVVAASTWWEKLYAQLESFLSNRAGMIQFGAIMAMLALVIIWWRR
jgi:hypothetical protein